MEEQKTWEIISCNLPALVAKMVTIPTGSYVDVFTDHTGSNISFQNPSGACNVKLCAMTSPDLNNHYDIRQQGADFVNGDGERIPRDQLPAVLLQYIQGMKDGSAEWGWEFKID